MVKSVRYLAIAAALFCCTGALAPANAQTLIPNLPSMKNFPNAHELPDPSLNYKIVFNVKTMASSPDKISPALVMIGVLINTYERHGVPADHLHFQAVFHGETIQLVLDDATYKARTGVDHNPNDELLQQLKKAGLQMDVCGQSAMAQHYDFKSIQPIAQINYSASITFINLMTRGYIRIDV